MEEQAGMFKQNSELNLNSSLTYLQIPQSHDTEKVCYIVAQGEYYLFKFRKSNIYSSQIEIEGGRKIINVTVPDVQKN